MLLLRVGSQHSKFSPFQIFPKSGTGGGLSNLNFSPNVNVNFKCFRWTKNKLSLKWFLSNFKCYKLMLFLRGVPKIQNFPNFKFFPTRSEGGSLNFHFFPNSKKSKTSWGQENCGLFPLFVTFFNSEASLRNEKKNNIQTWVFKVFHDID